MSKRFDFYFRERVTEAELDGAFAGLEDADRNAQLDNGIVGHCHGGSVSEHAGTPNMTADVSGPYAGYDQLGQRIAYSGVLQNVNLAVDSLGVSTAVVGGANSKKLSIFIAFDRLLSDPRTDGNSNTVYFQRDEYFRFVVVQSAEAVSPTLPALDPTMLLLADVDRAFGQTTIVNANINIARRQDAFVTTGAFSVRAGTAKAALQQLVDQVNSSPAGGVNYAGGPAWLDGTTNPAATVEAQLDKIIADISDQVGATADGASRVGAEAVGSFVRGSVRSQLNALDVGWAKLARADSISGAWTFNNTITALGTGADDVPHTRHTSAGTNRILIDQGPVNNYGFRSRVYYSKVYGFERTVNAEWSTTGPQWQKDVNGVGATREILLTTYQLQAQEPTVNTWADNAWTRTQMSHATGDGVSTFTPATWYQDKSGNFRFQVDHNGFPIGGALSQFRTEWSGVSPALPNGWTRTSVAGGPTSSLAAPDSTHGYRRRVKSVATNGDVDVDYTDPFIAVFANQVVALEFEVELDVVGTNHAKSFVGLSDQPSTTNPFGGTAKAIGILYDSGVGNNWLAYNRNGASATQTDTGLVAGAGGVVHVRIEFHGSATAMGATTVLFFLNGTLVSTSTTNIPTAAMQQLIYHEALAGIAAPVALKVSPTLVVWNRHLAPPNL